MIARTALAALLACAALNARVTRIVIEQRESPAYKGQAFGQAPGPRARLAREMLRLAARRLRL